MSGKSLPFLFSERNPSTTSKYNAFWQSEFLVIQKFVKAAVENTRGKLTPAILAKHPLLRDPYLTKRKSPSPGTDNLQARERRSKNCAGGFRSISEDPAALVTFNSPNIRGLRSVNAFAKLASSQKTTFLETKGGDAEPIHGEEESEKEKSSESSGGENSSSDSSVESSFIRGKPFLKMVLRQRLAEIRLCLQSWQLHLVTLKQRLIEMKVFSRLR
ncbi:uncharacterized protein LOC113341069 [Papaver somniferum]|uniref:uncharacterized protein LOC113341069 n=1 Tax=Papaver somniferum TaxID=3469 RepID=UPI000E6F4AB1|nr:uncharacterized protein LOC113341069 [Papaver somniferum]